MNDKKLLKITQKGFEHYTGPLSVYEFVDGLSQEPIPRVERDRIAATMSCVEVAENGKETVAGVAERLIAETKVRAPKPEPLKRQSVDDKVAEEVSRVEKDLGGVKKIYTEEQLDKVIEAGGIAALRKIAEIWGVKNRSIPTLRQMVLDSQEAYVATEGSRIEKYKTALADTIKAVAAPPKPVDQMSGDDDEGDLDIDEDITATAAATGDMSAALSVDEGAE